MKPGKIKFDISGACCIFILNILWTNINFDIKILPSDNDIEADICGSDHTDNACLSLFTNVVATVAICIHLL